MIAVADITTKNWSFGIAGPGEVAQGLNDISQSMVLILTTRKRTDPLRPEFGSDIFDHIDTPLPIAAPNMVKAIIEAINLWEPRVNLAEVQYEYQDEAGEKLRYPAGLRFNIGWRLLNGPKVYQLSFLVAGSVGTAQFFVLATEDYAPILTESNNQLLI